MNLANQKLSYCFRNKIKYKLKNRRTEFEQDDSGDNVVYAVLYKTRIARNKAGQLAVRVGNWPTKMTTGAIRACLPPFWEFKRGFLISPNGNCIPVGADWVDVKEPAWYLQLVEMNKSNS
jgi:hypothetical protein